MAIQESPFPLKGNIGKLSFYKTKDGYRARTKTGVDAARIKNDPNFRLTRENGAEFGRAGKAVKLFRATFKKLIKKAADSTASKRLVSLMMTVLKADAVSDRGQRTVMKGNPALLEGFQFNNAVELEQVLSAPVAAAIDRESGQATVTVEAFIPQNSVTVPDGATHFRLTAALAAIDFEMNSGQMAEQSTPEIHWNNNAVDTITLQPALPAGHTHPLFLVLGVEFFQLSNNKFSPLSKGANALKLLKVSAAVQTAGI